jgi:(p)ppGpp synthase/HD superfamily hydrolase
MYTYRVELAIRAAALLHKDQVRKGSVPIPYISHLMAVVLILSDYTDDEDTIIAAFLHDTLEDTDYTESELREDFGGTVRDYVVALTEPQDNKTKSYTWKERQKAYAKFLKKAPEASLMIAAADKIHNMRAIVEEYHGDHGRFIAEFGGSLADRIEMYQDIANAINNGLKNEILEEFNHVFTEYKNFIIDVQKTKDAQGN